MKKMLLIIDPQNDFIDGSLAVGGAEEKMNALATFVSEHGKEYEVVAFTADWHPANHCSFKENGGIWPAHCVQHSHGAAIHGGLFSALMPLGCFSLTKGDIQGKEEYSVMDNERSSKELLSIIESHKIGEIDVCGIAGDYCVLESMKGLRNSLPEIKMNAIERFIPFIGEPDWNEFNKINADII